jgi:hypothetical protein
MNSAFAAETEENVSASAGDIVKFCRKFVKFCRRYCQILRLEVVRPFGVTGAAEESVSV